MSKRRRSFREPMLAIGRTALWVGLCVGSSILFLENKVRLDDVAQQIDQINRRSSRLREERAQLLGLIVFRQKPGTIEQIARGRLAMGYPVGHQNQLTFDAVGRRLPE